MSGRPSRQDTAYCAKPPCAALIVRRSMLHFPLEQCDLFLTQIDQPVHAVVDLGFGVGELSGQGVVLAFLVAAVWFTFVSGLGASRSRHDA